ncbi:CubicO group peptidase (beta-lactamase class C family) [Streptomyces sp. CG 926]|uniref:serine hydrolase domain-containing protein n=1 Tax=Streptomyces sp. CG 926 TaxID=1882405 RepID=UPI000D6D1DA4|nr:serine hydrolase domain-containing protein [Streptomyces sp. CG 926]PWK64158.1 CubicO group peptidase (beta-lactamase class C family) [Streptomyces sp. CG 926]
MIGVTTAHPGRARTALLCATALLGTVLPAGGAWAATGAGSAAASCVASPEPSGGEAKQILDIAKAAQKELDLNAVVLRVTRDGREIVTGALGESMTGVPATADMHFRAGSVAIVYMGIAMLQLVEEGKAELDDPISRWLPDAPHADKITLRMLGASTSGLRDYVPDPKFLAALYADPFRQWTPDELVGISAAHPLLYEPGTSWSYSHANFVLLGQALEKISGMPLAKVMERQITGPAGLDNTLNSFTPQIEEPVLHSFDAERGKYEESTYWNPSWTTAPGAVLNTHICDLARSAEVVGTGELLSPQSFKVQLDPGTVGLGGNTPGCAPKDCFRQLPARHFGYGVIVQNGWIQSNPSFAGYAAIQAYLPSEHLAIAVSTTVGPKGPETNTAQTIAARIAAVLAPENSLTG